MKKQFIMLLLCIAGCTNKNQTCATDVNEVLKNNLTKVHVAYREKNKILGISDNGKNGEAAGGAYYFYPSGKIQSYKYFKTDSAYVYDEEFDESGKLARTVGSPLVNMDIREVSIDSAFFKFYYSTLHKIYGNLSVFINENRRFSIELKDDSTYSNMKQTSFGMDTKGLKKINIYFSINCQDGCTGKDTTLKDTLSMVKNPHLNPALQPL